MMNEAEVLITCPYNKAHSILKGRMQFHLTKCRLQHPTSDMVTCPYNTTHIIPRMEIEIHQSSCPDRIIIDRFLYKLEGTDCPVRDTVPVNTVEVPPSDENWDDCITEVSALDVVKENIKGKSVLINLIGAPKSERKAHRNSERRRHQIVSDGKNKKDAPLTQKYHKSLGKAEGANHQSVNRCEQTKQKSTPYIAPHPQPIMEEVPTRKGWLEGPATDLPIKDTRLPKALLDMKLQGGTFPKCAPSGEPSSKQSPEKQEPQIQVSQGNSVPVSNDSPHIPENPSIQVTPIQAPPAQYEMDDPLFSSTDYGTNQSFDLLTDGSEEPITDWWNTLSCTEETKAPDVKHNSPLAIASTSCATSVSYSQVTKSSLSVSDLPKPTSHTKPGFPSMHIPSSLETSYDNSASLQSDQSQSSDTSTSVSPASSSSSDYSSSTITSESSTQIEPDGFYGATHTVANNPAQPFLKQSFAQKLASVPSRIPSKLCSQTSFNAQRATPQMTLLNVSVLRSMRMLKLSSEAKCKITRS